MREQEDFTDVDLIEDTGGVHGSVNKITNICFDSQFNLI